jgi:hypothetical protein
MCIELHLGPRFRPRKITLTDVNSIISGCVRHWLTSCNLAMYLSSLARPGCHLITWSGSTSVMPVEVSAKKRSLLPLLTILFLFSYGLMTVLIVEQGSVIQSQRNLIKVLGRDSTELWSAKGKAIGDQQTAQSQAQGRVQTPSTQVPAQTPSTQVPSTQSPLTETPSTQAAPQRGAQSRTGKTAKRAPLPPMPASDLVDRRRALNTI